MRRTLPRRRFLQGSLALAGSTMATGCLSNPLGALWPKKVPRIGVLTTVPTQGANGRNVENFYRGMRDLGYVDGENVIYEYRRGESNLQLPELAAELVGLNPDVIFVGVSPAAEATKKATSTIPIVMASSANAVEVGLVASLARPGGNLTGLTADSVVLVGKQLQLVKDTLPNLKRLAVFFNSTNIAMARALQANRDAARSFGIELFESDVRVPDDLPAAFSDVLNARAEALWLISSVQSPVLDPQYIAFTRDQRLPSFYSNRDAVVGGGMMGFVSDLESQYYRAATFVDKILKGAKPADLPVEQPHLVQLIVNMGTAQMLGVTITPCVQSQVSEFIP